MYSETHEKNSVKMKAEEMRRCSCELRNAKSDWEPREGRMSEETLPWGLLGLTALPYLGLRLLEQKTVEKNKFLLFKPTWIVPICSWHLLAKLKPASFLKPKAWLP